MTSAEVKLKERIKELTCLYEVTSIIVNSDYDQLETSLAAISNSLKKAWQYEKEAEILLEIGAYRVVTKKFDPQMPHITSDIKVFNAVEGLIKIGYPAAKFSESDFLVEEQKLLDNISLAVGNLMERKQIRDSEALVKRQMERTDRLHILGEITAGIAHELNTPLANILGFAELLKEKLTNEEDSRDMQKIVDNAIFSREIVKKLMFFACEMPQEMKRVVLNPVVENVIKLLKPSLKEKGIRVTTNFSSENISLKADTVQLTQVLFNLIMNAVYYSPVNGEINIKISVITDKIRIQISDEGDGIDPKIEDKVFDPFFTTKPMGEGSGLGLSVVHGIISSHQGSITHHPNGTKGTVFTVDFPKL